MSQTKRVDIAFPRDVNNTSMVGLFTKTISDTKASGATFSAKTLSAEVMGAHIYGTHDFLLKVNDDTSELRIPANTVIYLPVVIKKISVKQVSEAGNVYLIGYR